MSQWITCVVSSRSGTNFCSSTSWIVWSITSWGHCPSAVEISCYYSHSQDHQTRESSRLQTNISNSSLVTFVGEIHREIIHLYSTTTSPPGLDFNDQCAFRPSDSTTTALVALFHTIRTLLSTNPFVHVYFFDFSKAFDFVHCCTLMTKMTLPDNIYNWIKDFFDENHHCTQYADVSSTEAAVTSSVIQGSGLGPASYLVVSADIHPVHPATIPGGAKKTSRTLRNYNGAYTL